MGCGDADTALLRVVDQARQLHRALDVVRLQRMLFIYRSWVASVSGVTGGFSLTRDELACVLEFPSQLLVVDFLMDTFRANPPIDQEQEQDQRDDARIDLLTLLATCTCLARGALHAKAAFLFALVDFDVEDEIVESELAMLVALCSDGLRRLGVVCTELCDLDARAIACEAFEFVGIEWGDKMPLALFERWLVSHWRPAALFDRIQTLFLLSSVAQRLHDVLMQYERERESSVFQMYNRGHFETDDPEAETTRIVLGPTVASLTAQGARILIEVNRSTTVQCFAFRIDPIGTARPSQRKHDRLFTIDVAPSQSCELVLSGLSPGDTYQIRFLGVCKRDRERCIAFVTTPSASEGVTHAIHAKDTTKTAILRNPIQECANDETFMTGLRVGRVTDSTATLVFTNLTNSAIAPCLVDRFIGETFSTPVLIRRPHITLCVFHGLTPGRLYEVYSSVRLAHASEGRRNVAGLVQTLLREPTSVRILAIADDSFCSQTVLNRRNFVPSRATSLMGDIVSHLADGTSKHGSSLMIDLTIRMGAMLALRHDLLGGYELMCKDVTTSPDAVDHLKKWDHLEEMVRKCIQVHSASRDYSAILSRGANYFVSVGLVRNLLQNGAPLPLLEATAKVVQNNEPFDVFSAPGNQDIVLQLSHSLEVVKLDTTNCLFAPKNQGFVSWPEHLLTSRQISAIQHAIHSADEHESATSARTSKQILILCDAPFVWPFRIDAAINRKTSFDKVLQVASDPWSHYPADLERLLDLLFDVTVKKPLLRIMLVCCGSFASRVVITHKQTGRSIEQLTIGAISNIDRQPLQVARYSPERVLEMLGHKYAVAGHATGGSELSLRQYCVLDFVPHSQGTVCTHAVYTAGRPDARVVLGPVIGRVTTRTARILIEVDRPALKAVCIATSSAAGRFISAEYELEAFTPTIFKLEGLHPGTRYALKFEGLMVEEDSLVVYVDTPPLVALSVEWLVFSRNNLRHLLPNEPNSNPTSSHWSRILSPGVPGYSARSASIASNRQGDTLGNSTDLEHKNFNPWHHVEAFALSEPLRQTQLSVHLGGQVDMSTAFAEEELAMLIGRLCDASIDEDLKSELYKTIRFRLQEVYRVAWGVEPIRTILASTSNAMILHEDADVFFSASRLQELLKRCPVEMHPNDDQVGKVAFKLRAIAFELWQLYQNQLVVDVNESDLDNSRHNSSKFASHITLGLCRLVVVNVSDELREAASNAFAADRDQPRIKTPQAGERVVPLTLPSVAGESQLPLFSSATWRILDEAMDLASSEPSPGAKQPARVKAVRGASSAKQLVVFLAVDMIETVTKYPSIRSEVSRLFEKLFEWKLVARTERQVSLICASEISSSMRFTITDEKVNETLVMTRVGSISKPCGAQLVRPQPKGRFGKSASVVKGHFSKRFTYESSPIPTISTTTGSNGHNCRSYAKYLYLSDYRRGVLSENLLYFPSKTLPKIELGPVIGRVAREQPQATIISEETETADLVDFVTVSVPILVEINSPARLTCIVVDSMINTETRVTNELQGGVPHVFRIQGLVPLRRYVYWFEGASNTENCRGCFHTPLSEGNNLNLVVVSSNFPTQMDEEQDSLWVPLLERAKLPWCGLDAILHLGGQVPLHEAAVECFHWVKRQLSREILHGEPSEVDKKREQHVRTRVRRRFQQEYYVCWNLPNIRELLAHASHWFLPSKSDIAPFCGREMLGDPQAARAVSIVLDVAREVVHSYQIQLGISPIDELVKNEVGNSQTETDEVRDNTSPHQSKAQTKPSEGARIPSAISELGESKELVAEGIEVDAGPERTVDPIQESALDKEGAICWQYDDIVVFMTDSTSPVDADVGPITCNGRLSRALSRQENPMMSEKQWRFFVSVLRKKRTQLLVLCMELPLILTNADHMEKLRDELRSSQDTGTNWELYDHTHVVQHWTSCKRQLEQLLLLLFKWKAKCSGRDVVLLSGGMRIGMDTILQDRETKLSIQNFTVGPVTANVETFEFPLSGVACATFGGGLKDDHFTFRHSLVAKKNYLLLQASVEEPVETAPTNGLMPTISASKAANVVAGFVPNELAALNRLHPVEKFRRYPKWWTLYVPMGKAVFWDDTITLKSETDDRMLALRDYVWHDRGFSGALEVFYEKYQFAETARMEELRSRYLQHVDLKASFMGVLSELWCAIPESKRQQMAYFLDPFVLDMLMSHAAPGLFTHRLQSGEPIELAYFSRVIREFVFDACLLRLTIITQREDEIQARQDAIENQQRDAEKTALDKAREEQAAKEGAERMAELLRTNPLEYAKIKLASEEAEKIEKLQRHQEKIARKKAERLAEIEEEEAIAKEQKKFDKLAERDPIEYERRQHELDGRIRKLEEKRAQRAAQKKATAEKSEKGAEQAK